MAQVHLDSKKEKEKNTQNTRYMRDRDREKVTGVFHNYEIPGGAMEFVYREYKEDPVEKFNLVDGQVYQLPRGVVRHLNKNCWYPEYEYYSDGGTRVQNGMNPNVPGGNMRVGKKVRRVSFESMEFMDLNDIPPAKQIVTVEHI